MTFPFEALSTAVVLAALIWALLWDMRNTQRQARNFAQQHGLMKRRDS